VPPGGCCADRFDRAPMGFMRAMREIQAGHVHPARNQLIQELRKAHEMSAVVVTHDLRSAEALADRVVLLNEGHIVVEGTFDEVKDSDDPFVAAFVKPTFTREHD